MYLLASLAKKWGCVSFSGKARKRNTFSLNWTSEVSAGLIYTKFNELLKNC
jgi:hypothetical protein